MIADTANPIHRFDTEVAYRTAVEKVISHMKQHLDDHLNLDRFAQVAAVSKFRLIRVFEEITGTTPCYFLACLRIQRAKELLLESEKSVTDICLDVGYSSLGSFCESFRDLVGVPPTVFRSFRRTLDPAEFLSLVRKFLDAQRATGGPELQGVVEAPQHPRGFIFVGAFAVGVPKGIPESGTVLLVPGPFRMRSPSARECHVLAALVPFSADFATLAANVQVALVASQRLERSQTSEQLNVCMRLRPTRLTDPPIVVAFPSLLAGTRAV